MVLVKDGLVVIMILSALSLAVGTFIFPLSSMVIAQTNTTSSMTSTMTEFARQHLKAADTALSNNDTAGALDLLSLAELQIALVEMESAGAMTEAQISEFMERGTMSDSDPVTDYCLLNIDGVLQCRYPR